MAFDSLGDGVTNKAFTSTEKTKLAGLAAQVQSDWNASSGLGQILNKPTISGTNTGDQDLSGLVTKLRP